MATFDSVIIGGGIIGCSLARALAGEGLRVAVVERNAPGEEASGAAAGMLAPSAEAEKGSPTFPLCRASLLAYRPWVEELRAETGVDPQYGAEGSLLLFANEQERQQMLPSMQWQHSQNIAVRELNQGELRSLEPNLGDFPGAFFLPDDHQVDNRLLMHALVQSCRQRGVEFLLGKPAREISRNGDHVVGVILGDASGTKITASRVVNTAGAWAAAIPVAGIAPPPIRPVKGHMVALEAAPGTLRHVIRSHRGYLVPRKNGRILVGSTMEEAGFDKTPRAAQIAGLLGAAQTLCPALQSSALAECWAGLRPASKDGLPLLGPTELEGYWLALGHFRNGILLAPITAQILTAWIVSGKPPLSVDALAPQRFAGNAA
ncbi:MAG TPA: glycine oxidase ThiO [Terriglobia bacterium]|nr:glycine oxidase ThiO [Terriglobia bacterium]